MVGAAAKRSVTSGGTVRWVWWLTRFTLGWSSCAAQRDPRLASRSPLLSHRDHPCRRIVSERPWRHPGRSPSVVTPTLWPLRISILALGRVPAFTAGRVGRGGWLAIRPRPLRRGSSPGLRTGAAVSTR